MDTLFSPITVLAALFMGCLGSYLAYRRGRNPYGWFFIGFLFGALGILAIFFAPSRKKIIISAPAVDPQPASSPSIQGPTDKFWYYLDPAHQQMGPMSLNALTAEWRQGKISLSTYIWHEELPEWKPLQDFVK